MTTPDPEQIAAGLTKAQRLRLALGGPFLAVQLNTVPKIVIPELEARGLLYAPDGLDGKPHWLVRHFTPLGLAVRNIVKGQSDAT